MRTPPVGNSSSAPNLLPEQAAVPVAAVRRRPSRGQSRVAAPSAAAIGASPLVRSKNMADRSSSTAQMDSSLGPGEGSPTQRSSAASPTFKRSLTSRAWIPAESETPRPPSKARSSSPPHRPRSTSPPARLAEAVAALSAAATGMAANLLSTRPSELPSDTAGGPAESSEPAAESLRERQPLKMFAAVPGRSSSPVEVPRGGSPGPAGRTLLLSTADRKLKTSQMAVLTTLEEEERMRLGPLQARASRGHRGRHSDLRPPPGMRVATVPTPPRRLSLIPGSSTPSFTPLFSHSFVSHCFVHTASFTLLCS
jgi:hypothetical protein